MGNGFFRGASPGIFSRLSIDTLRNVVLVIVCLAFAAGLSGMRFCNKKHHATPQHDGHAQCRKSTAKVGRSRSSVKLPDGPSDNVTGKTQWKARMDVMVSKAKEAFGVRLSAILEATGVGVEELMAWLGLTSKVQINNYLKGEQGPTFEGMAKMRGLFGMTSGQIDGSEDFPSQIDREGIRKRLSEMA